MQRYCETCNQEFKVPPAVVNKGHGKFCSRKCQHIAFSKRVGKDNPHYQPEKHILCKCLICEKEFIARAWAIQHKGEGKCCSRKCHGIYRSRHLVGNKSANWRNAKTDQECKQCGSIFQTTKVRLKNGRGKFCSRKCIDDYKSIHWIGDKCGNWKGGPLTKQCPICNKEFTVSKSRHKDGRGRVCSKECLRTWLSQNYSGENSARWLDIAKEYPAEWNRFIKHQIRKRDNYLCQICNKSEYGKAHDVHHIDYDKNNTSEINLITLCHSCHTKTNYKRDKWTIFFQGRCAICLGL